MLQGTIIKNSLKDVRILELLTVIKSWSAGSWKLYRVSLDREDALSLSLHICEGPWYAHFWNEERTSILVVFKDRVFEIKRADKSTWADAIEYGKSIGILEEQLDFTIDQSI